VPNTNSVREASTARPKQARTAAGRIARKLRPGFCDSALISSPSRTLKVPVLPLGAGGDQFTAATMKQVARNVTSGSLEGVGHYAALEAPERVTKAIREFVEQGSSP